MPNWCSNNMVVYGPEKDVMAFYQTMKKATSDLRKGKIENDWDNNWLGNLFYEVGYTEEQVTHEIHCRGWVDGIELEDFDKEKIVRIYYESAWSPSIDDFEEMLTKFFPTLNQVTLSEECGCEIYINTDIEKKYFIDKYYIDTCVDGEYWSEYYGYGEEDLMVEHYNQLRKTHFRDLCEIMEDAEKFNENNDDDFIMIHEFTPC